MKCPKCGKKMKKQGGQYVCMNESCSEYLMPKSEQKYKSPIAKMLVEGE